MRSARLAEFKRRSVSSPIPEGNAARRRVERRPYPGEIEHRREQDRRQNGIEVEDSTWDKIKSLRQDYGLARQLALLNKTPSSPSGRRVSTASIADKMRPQ